MWPILPVETALEAALKNTELGFGEQKGAEIYGRYTSARAKCISDIYPFIWRFEPDLTAHDSSHVENVLANVFYLLGEDLSKLHPQEIYVLLIAVLFHDVGVLLGREEHRNKLGEIYWHIRSHDNEYRHEKFLVTKIVRAHTGQANDGSKDTLDDLKDDGHLFNKEVRTQQLAAILRFADELAEGPQRTSDFILRKHGFRLSSEIFHRYALATQLYIDRGGGRVALTYHISLDIDENGAVLPSCEDPIKELLKFIYSRVLTLDQERRYAKHYCSYLSPFKSTSLQLNFHVGDLEYDLDLKQIVMTDKVVPGRQEDMPSTGAGQAYNPDQLWTKLSVLRSQSHPLGGSSRA